MSMFATSLWSFPLLRVLLCLCELLMPLLLLLTLVLSPPLLLLTLVLPPLLLLLTLLSRWLRPDVHVGGPVGRADQQTAPEL